MLQVVDTRLERSHPIQLDRNYQQLDFPNCISQQIWQLKIRHDFHHLYLASVVHRIPIYLVACRSKIRNDVNQYLEIDIKLSFNFYI